MKPSRVGRFKSWLNQSRKRNDARTPAISGALPESSVKLSNPVDNYYRHKVQTNLQVFYRFALQTRSLKIRDVFAKAASRKNLDLVDLLSVLEAHRTTEVTANEKQSIAFHFDSNVLLTLADLLSNTARDEFDTHSAVKIYNFVWTIYGNEAFSEPHMLQYVEALNELGNYAQSEHFADIFQIEEIAPLQKELLNVQKLRRTTSSANDWLKNLNAVYGSLGMTQVRLIDDNALPLMDRLAAQTSNPLDGPRVSVIMPSFSPGPGIRTAIRGLLEQSWQNLEIIVVDDASPEAYEEIYLEIERLDPRIRILKQKRNEGAYVARNAGLAVASGEFITTHDDDDWSHPDKIARQVEVFLENPSIVATTSAHIRTTPDLHFRRVNMRACFLQMNYSSLMIRKTSIQEIGNWDTVNRGGDSEFYTRVIEYFGADRVVGLIESPLSFSRVWDGSLTSGEMSRGFFAYSRLLYRWAFRQWQWDQGKLGRKAIRELDKPRPYAIPTTFESGERATDLGVFDVIYVTDFFRQAKFVDYVLNEIETLSEHGFRVAYMHLNSPETSLPAGFPKRLFELQLEKQVTQVSHDDVAETKLLLVYDTSIGMFADQITSALDSHRSIVINHELPRLVHAEERYPTLLPEAVRHLDACFNTNFEVVGSTLDHQARIRTSIPSQRVLPNSFTWYTHVRREPGKITPPQGQPIVGFHSYGNLYRWPKNVDEFSRVYSSRHYRTQLYGQLEILIEKFGPEALANIDLVDLEETEEQHFLKGIDFWVYYPHERLVDQTWEPVLEAMQAGKVVVLPPELEPIYETAAVYSDINDIADTVATLSADATGYLRQAEAGQKFIAKHYTKEKYLQRITRLGDSRESL